MRFANRTDEGDEKIYVSRSGDVGDLRAEIAKAFPLRVPDRSLLSLKIDVRTWWDSTYFTPRIANSRTIDKAWQQLVSKAEKLWL